MRTAPLLPHGGGPGGESCISFYFCSAAGPRVSGTHFLKERAISFSSGFSGQWDNRVRRVASSLSPTTHQPKKARFGDAVPPQGPSSQSHLGPREFGKDDSEHAAFCTIQPYSPSLHHHRYVNCAVGAAFARHLVAWLMLPSTSHWLTRTIRLGYAIQFARRPPKFNGVLETAVAAWNAPVLHKEIAVLLTKDAIEPVPPAEMRQGFYSPYFIAPKKGGSHQPILDRLVLNRASSPLCRETLFSVWS